NAADYNGDGLLDLVLVRRFDNRNILIRNDGVGGIPQLSGDVYEDVDDSNSGCWGDVNNDGLPELLVLNTDTANTYYVNQSGTLVRDLTQPFLDHEGKSVGCAWGDYDGDGDLDLAITFIDTINQSRTQLFQNNAGTFTQVPLETRLLDSSGLAWGDVDNDGDLDLVVAHRAGQAPTLYSNDGDGTFTPVDFGTSTTYSVAVTLVDDDEDGDLDLFITNGGYNITEPNNLYRNITDESGNWL